MADEPTTAAQRIAYAAAFMSFDEPIGRIVGNDVYPTETFLRLLESLFLRTGGETDQIKEVADETQAVVETAEELDAALVTVGEAVVEVNAAVGDVEVLATAAQASADSAEADAAAAQADATAATTALDGATLVGTQLADFETRISGLENP